MVQTLKNSIFEFYKLYHEKGINYFYDEWKNCELSKTHQEKAAGNQSGHFYQNV